MTVRSIHERMTAEVPSEDFLEPPHHLVGLEASEFQPVPGLRRALDDARAGFRIETVRVKPDPTGIGLFERERERIEDLVRPEPDVVVRVDLDARAEFRLVAPADPAVDAVTGDDEVGAPARGEIFDLVVETNLDA
jgi:hypothetical protein